MISFDFDTAIASRGWIEQQLKTHGYLEAGNVSNVSQNVASVNTGASAKLFQLEIDYSAASTGHRPQHCLMKVSRPAATREFAERAKRYAAWAFVPQEARFDNLAREVAFYEAPTVATSELPLLKCFGTEIEESTKSVCLLLEDLTATHGQPPFPMAPSKTHCEGTIEAIAELHAHWWEDVPEGPGSVKNHDALIDEVMSFFATSFETFSDLLGDRLSQPRRRVYEQTLESLPALLKTRFRGAKRLTCVHGDAHHWNVLLPHEEGPTVVLDWQTWREDIPAYDLAYLMGLWWYREHREREEQRLLRLYRERLAERDVEYQADDLAFDYRLSILRHLFTPVILSNFVVPAVWWPHVDRIFCTFEDWDCEELLDQL